MSTDIVIGIDISGKSLDIHILPEDRAQRFANDASGIGELVELAKEMEASLIVMEATGGLESALAAECALSGIPTAVMNPRQIRDFARSLGRLAKTDAIDAEVIARFGSALRPEPRTLPDAQEQHLRALMTRRRQLIDIRTAESNRLARAAAAVRQRIRKHIDFLNQEIEDIDREIEKLIKESPLWLEKARLLREVPGIGSVSCFTLLGALPEPGQAQRKADSRAGGSGSAQQGQWSIQGKAKHLGRASASEECVVYGGDERKKA